MLGKSPSIQNGEVRDRKRLFYINHIFESNSNNRYTKTALLYQDILKFENDFDKKYGSEFTFNDLAKWLMKQNLGFATYYSDSKAHVTMSNRIANRRDSIQNCIDDFISSKLISIVGTKKAQKNDFRTQLYKFTQAGEVLSYLLSARKWIN